MLPRRGAEQAPLPYYVISNYISEGNEGLTEESFWTNTFWTSNLIVPYISEENFRNPPKNELEITTKLIMCQIYKNYENMK